MIGPRGAPLGFTMLKGDEVYQLYVSREARGRGVAAALMADAEQRLAARGVSDAWLACAIGNERAARFYEKQGGVAPARWSTSPRRRRVASTWMSGAREELHPLTLRQVGRCRATARTASCAPAGVLVSCLRTSSHGAIKRLPSMSPLPLRSPFRPRDAAKPIDDFEWPPTADSLSVYQVGPDPFQTQQDPASHVPAARQRERSQPQQKRTTERAPAKTQKLVVSSLRRRSSQRPPVRAHGAMARPVAVHAVHHPPPRPHRRPRRPRSRSSRPTRSSLLRRPMRLRAAGPPRSPPTRSPSTRSPRTRAGQSRSAGHGCARRQHPQPPAAIRGGLR